MIYRLTRAALFRLEPEDAHELVMHQMQRLQKIPFVMRGIRSMTRVRSFPRTVWGMSFSNPIGLAAGFDKDAEVIDFLESLGFGFTEVGTVTLRPQPGNPRPRLFRYPKSKALINRLGFNNRGAEAAAKNLKEWWRRNEKRRKRPAPLFVNIGKNRDVALEDAPQNYADCYDFVAPWADAVVVNVSSPNTASLRDLQRPEHLEAILLRLRERREATSFAREGKHPIIVKIAPDITDAQLRETADVCLRLADGMTATNTTISRVGLAERTEETGGMSGRPLLELSNDVLSRLRGIVGRDYPVIGVGGVFDADDAAKKIAAGADLIQAYTGFIYEGPTFVKKIVGRL